MTLRLDQSSVAEINLALSHDRRLLIRPVAIVILGFPAVIGLSHLGYALPFPYGLRIPGEDLTSWGLLGPLAPLVLKFWWEGRQVANALDEPSMQASPINGLWHGFGVIAERVSGMGVKWGPFHGPLRPVRRR